MKIVAQHNQRILIVDDDEDLRRAVIDSLTM
jgi:DNA-binding NtrC family response regulator